MNNQWKKRLFVIAVAVCMIITAVFSVSAATTTDVNAGEITKISDGVISQEYSEIKSYRENNYTVPGTPSGYSNYVFAGWFTDAKCTTETTATSGAAHAKFVIEDVLSVKAQFLAGTSYATEQSDMRFVTTVDSLDYEEVGFKCEINGVTKTAKSDTVYKKLYASLKKGDGSTAISTLLPTAFSETTSKYFMACILKDIPNADFGDAIKITPYWITLDGTKVYGEPVVKTVNNGYVDIATGVTVQQNPVIDYSEDYKTYITDTTLTYWPQGGCIGVQDGKTYYYQAMVSTDESNSVSHILKIDMTTGKIEMCSDDLDLGHTNDITYNKDLDVLVVCQNNPNYQRISFVDPSTLTVVNPNNIRLEFGDGVTVKSTYITTSHKETRSILSWTWTEDVENTLFSLEYNSHQEKYVVGMSGGQSFRILNSDFSDPNASGDAFSPTENTSGYTTQNVVADDSYIYFLLYHGGEVDNTSYEGHVIAVYDWNGNYVTVLEIPTSSIAKNVEPENMAIYDNQMYISCGNKEIYKVATFDISEAEFEAKIENYYTDGRDDTTGYFETLEEAVEEVQDGQTIIITSPNVSVSENLNIDNANVTITNEAGMNVTVKKGADFSGNLISNNADGLKIQGADTGSLTFAGNGYSGSSLVAVNNQVTIEKVNFKNLEANYNGGAVNVRENASATIKKCKFDNNTAGEQGGAIYVSANATTTVEDSTFTGNKTINYSGGAIRSDGALTVTGSTFTKNESATVGGALIGDGEISSLTLTDCQFESNTSNGNGGAVQASTGCVATLNVTENGTGTFLNNSANGAGGAIRTNNAALTVTGYQFLGNTSTGSGGAINIGGSNEYEGVSDQTICLEENTFVSNTAGGNGGAVYNATRTIEMTSCTFGQDVENEGTTTQLGNEAAGNGGAFYVGGGANATLTSVIFKNNTAGGNGGAIYNAESSNTTLDGTGSFDNNKAKCEMSADNYGGGAICVGSGNLDVDGYSFTDNNVVGRTGGAIRLNSTATISTIKNCQFTSNATSGITGDSYGGAAIYTHADKLTLEGSTFTSNATGGNGGAVCVISSGAELAITSCQFGDADAGNSAYRGGAIFCGEGAKVTTQTSADYQTESLFSNNSTTNRGGAIAVTNGSLTIKDYAFANNTSVEGGAIHLATNTIPLSIEGSSFNSNQATSSSGGAIYSNSQKTITITDTTFNGNTAPKAYGGAIFHNNSATMSITGGGFTSNTCYDAGGAIKMSGAAGETTITGVTFTGNQTSAGSGGAIRNEADLVVSGSAFVSNQSGTAGGAVIGDGSGSSLTITDTQFTSNTSGSTGGAVQASGGCTASITVTDNGTGTFSKNSATTTGGAIQMNNSVLTVNGYTFDGNSASTLGGAINIGNGTGSTTDVLLEDNIFMNNTASSNGGAIHNYKRSVKIINGTFNNNTAIGNGGAVYNGESGVINLTGTGSFSSNSAKCELSSDNYGGGAICIGSGTLSVEGYTFENNSSTSGGAIRVNTATELTIKTSVFKSNEVTGNGGAVFVNNSSIPVTITQSEFASNSASGEGGAIYSYTSNTTTGLAVGGTTFISNTASKVGGAICAYKGPANITDCNFGGTDSTNGNSANRGGAIYAGDGCKVTVKATEGAYYFKNNSTNNSATTDEARGGAIAMGSGSLTVEGYSFESNTSASQGGAIHLATSGIAFDLKNSSFDGNQATANGGAIYSNSYESLSIAGSTFESNIAKGPGGAIYVNSSHENSSTTVGLTITNSTFKSNQTSDSGAAIFSAEGSVSPIEVTGSTFTGNTATWSGGAMSVKTGTGKKLTVTGSTFKGNTGTKEYGGAIMVQAPIAEITDCHFGGENTADGNVATWGGAIYGGKGCALTIKATTNGYVFQNNKATSIGGGAIGVQQGTLTVENYQFTSNSSPSYLGGAIYLYKEDVVATIKGSLFRSNTAKYGGAIYNDSTNTTDGLKIENTGFTSNTATDSGAAICSGENSTAPTTITGSGFESNTATWNAGAIYIRAGKARTLTVSSESTFTSNTATKGYGGAIRIDASDVICTIQNSTFTLNTAPAGNGGAIYNASTNTADGMTIEDCKFNSNKSSSAGGALWSEKTKIVINRTDFTGNQCTTSTAGAIKIGGGSLTATDCNFTENTASGNGGVIEATGSNPTIVFTVSAGNEGEYGFYNNISTSGGGGAIRANWITSMSIYGYVFSGNTCGGSGSAINTGDGCSAGKVTLEKCTPLSDADISSHYSGAVVQTNSLQ